MVGLSVGGALASAGNLKIMRPAVLACCQLPMPLISSQLNRYVISAKGMTVVPAQLLAKIEAHNLKDHQAMARAREERIKLLSARQREKKDQSSTPT